MEVDRQTEKWVLAVLERAHACIRDSRVRERARACIRDSRVKPTNADNDIWNPFMMTTNLLPGKKSGALSKSKANKVTSYQCPRRKVGEVRGKRGGGRGRRGGGGGRPGMREEKGRTGNKKQTCVRREMGKY